ncbi:MAG: hypothetical protein COB66_00675 [Coxiella sp. (in: Bacteria)]|nr:MAG: hypothetical protein COB66_00675 [Coxiella sp. (in: g-proteobacteria)]
MPDLRHRLTELLNIFNISELDLSKATGVAQPTLNRLNLGISEDPKISTLKPIATYFNVTMGQLLGLEPLPANLNAQTIIEKRGYLEIPLIGWDQVKEYKTVIPDLNHNNWSDWVYSDEFIGSPLAYSLQINYSSYSSPFPQFTKLIIDPSFVPAPEDFIICLINNFISICKLVQNGTELVYKPVISQDYRTFNKLDNVSLYGVILGVQQSFKTKLIKDIS